MNVAAKSVAERQATHRERLRSQGLTRLELWLPKALHESVKKYADRLMRGRT